MDNMKSIVKLYFVVCPYDIFIIYMNVCMGCMYKYMYYVYMSFPQMRYFNIA